LLLPCLGEVATLLFAFKQKANDGVDGGVIVHSSLYIECWLLDIEKELGEGSAFKLLAEPEQKKGKT